MKKSKFTENQLVFPLHAIARLILPLARLTVHTL